MTTNLKDRYAGKCSELAEAYHGNDKGNWGPDYESGFNAALDLVQADIEPLITALENELSQIKYRDLSESGKLVKEALAKFK